MAVGGSTDRCVHAEASQAFGWPLSGALNHLKRHRQGIGKLVRFPLALQQIRQLGVQVLAISPGLIDVAAQVSLQK
jgi:hypothetical protein